MLEPPPRMLPLPANVMLLLCIGDTMGAMGMP